MKHPHDKLQLSDESAGRSARAPVGRRTPQAVASRYPARPHGVSCLTTQVRLGGFAIRPAEQPTSRKPWSGTSCCARSSERVYFRGGFAPASLKRVSSWAATMTATLDFRGGFAPASLKRVRARVGGQDDSDFRGGFAPASLKPTR